MLLTIFYVTTQRLITISCCCYFFKSKLPVSGKDRPGQNGGSGELFQLQYPADNFIS